MTWPWSCLEIHRWLLAWQRGQSKAVGSADQRVQHGRVPPSGERELYAQQSASRLEISGAHRGFPERYTSCCDGRWTPIEGPPPSQHAHKLDKEQSSLPEELGQASFRAWGSQGSDQDAQKVGLPLQAQADPAIAPRSHGRWPQPVPPGLLLSPWLPLSHCPPVPSGDIWAQARGQCRAGL